MKDLKLLIVDDLEEVRNLLKALLRTLGIKQIHEATDGREALRILENHHEIGKIERRNIQLVLCDINMPEMDGLKFLKVVKKEAV
ncbi:MAG: response regulator [Pseudomonadota bacterium]